MKELRLGGCECCELNQKHNEKQQQARPQNSTTHQIVEGRCLFWVSPRLFDAKFERNAERFTALCTAADSCPGRAGETCGTDHMTPEGFCGNLVFAGLVSTTAGSCARVADGQCVMRSVVAHSPSSEARLRSGGKRTRTGG